MGNKLQARKTALECGIPVIPGSEKLSDMDSAVAAAEKTGYPVMVKAAAGGGGRGMKVVRDPEELRRALQVAGAEAAEAFGDGTLYLEMYIPNARHIEVQIAADKKANVIHVGERDCSLQRRHQKMIEEAPAYSVPEETREAIKKAAVSVAKRIEYENLGTVEFVFDQDKGRFYFLEMNTRIQVEHPVTEMISGVDLVQEQIRIAAQVPLSVLQSEVQLRGHAIECRITAESPGNGFRPCPGLITYWSPPKGPGIRMDTHCYSGYFVPPYYDSLLGKVICWGGDRREAMDRMIYALDNFRVAGIDTNIPLLRSIFQDPCYREGRVNTTWVERWLARQN
jgi:acetyl-CoA carboxylase biotin carboxylase subunit